MSKSLSILDQGTFDHFTVTEHGMEFAIGTSRENWLDAVHQLCGMYEGTVLAKERTVMLLADALNYGQEAYGEDFAQAIDNTRQALGLSPKTIANAQSVYKRIEPSRRRDGITLGHYSVIAALEIEEQDKYCDQILTHKYTILDLKEVVAHDHPKTKRGKVRKTVKDTADTALQKLNDVANWLEDVDAKLLSKDWKSPLEKVHLVYRRRWQSGRKK